MQLILKIQRAVLACCFAGSLEDRGLVWRGSIRPPARDRNAARGASAVAERIIQNIVPRAANHNSAAAGTEGVGCAAVNVSFVDVMQARIHRYFVGGVQRFRRRFRLVLQLEVGVERREM